jgi:hypothetical protein
MEEWFLMPNAIVPPVIVRTQHVVRPNFDVYFPIVEGGPNPQAQQLINTRIMQEMHKLLASPYPPGTQAPPPDYTGGFEVKTNERHVLSISLIMYSYTGGAHGMTVIRSLTFDTRTGREYALAELFKPNSAYIAKINANIRAQIAARNLPLLGEFTGIAPNQDYYIADKALVIYFQLYDLVPYAYGFPAFPISVYELQNEVIEDGPLGRMMGHF